MNAMTSIPFSPADQGERLELLALVGAAELPASSRQGPGRATSQVSFSRRRLPAKQSG
jgi:hypothetical protein